MNSILLFPQDIIADGQALFTGSRYTYVKENFSLKTGAEIPCSVLGGNRGKGTITEIRKNAVVFDYKLYLEPLAKFNIHLIVAVSRPQIIKRLLLNATQLGVEKITFFLSEHSEKSYMTSQQMSKEGLEAEIYKALEQGYDSIPIIPEKKYSLKQALGIPYQTFTNLYAHTNGRVKKINQIIRVEESPFRLVVGPEKGFSPNEIDFLENLNFTSVTLGERVLRVDIAATAFISQLICKFY